MKFGAIDHFLTGVAVPVTSLRSESGCGIGEFADLKILADWCSGAGIELIQVLPVNDTGDDLSPYGAVSAFALNPALIRLGDVQGAEQFSDEIESFRVAHANDPRVDYQAVVTFKRTLLKKIFDGRKKQVSADKTLKRWAGQNAWLKPYVAFSILKQQNERRAWFDWPELQKPAASDIDQIWQQNSDEALFHTWVQYLLEQQFQDAARDIEGKGLRLKGDIPILMSVDSADVWANPAYFVTTYRAGAPPDMFSKSGQNWGFPVYNWEALREADFSWWKDRLRQADKFYHAYRIDHVLGFFRIWRVAARERTGVLGHFYPYPFLTRRELNEAGFDDGFIHWLSAPHITEDELVERAGEWANHVKGKYLQQVQHEPLYYLKPEVAGERWIEAQDEPPGLTEFLLDLYQDRTLIEVEDGCYFPHWYHTRTTSFRKLDDDWQERLLEVIDRRSSTAEDQWEDHGFELLSMMKETTPMLVCAEDLGVVPRCVPRVLERLGILSLKIERWAREYGEPGQPYIEPERFSADSVCTPSVHDTSTLRGWWEEDELDREEYYRLIGGSGEPPDHLTVDLAKAIVRRNIDSGSLIAVFQIQDFLALDERTRLQTPDEERINVPSDNRPENWKYRMPLTLESLAEEKRLTQTISTLSERRRRRALV